MTGPFTVDGKQILMVGPGFQDYGEFWHNGNHQFGMLRAAAYLKAVHDCRVTFVDGALEPEIGPAQGRLKDRIKGFPMKLVPCGNHKQDSVSKWQMYYGKPIVQIKNEMAKAPTPDEVWIGSGLTYHWETTADLVQMARQMFPSTRIRVGGIYPSLCPDHARTHCEGADIFRGEIPGADEFWPDYDVLDYELPFRTIKWNTGCTVSVQCSFCAVKTLEPKFKVNGGPESLEAYLDREIDKGVRTLRIWASQLLQPPQAFAELMDRLYLLQARKGVRLNVYASEGIQPSLFTPQMAERMVKAGFTHLTIPMESIDPETLAKYNKPSGISDYHRAVALAKEAGFSWIGAFIMIGTPQQALDEVVHAVVDCWYRRVTPVLMKYTIIPGSQDWETDAWVHEGKDLLELHPSLWCGARPGLRVLELEEIVGITRMGYSHWSRTPQGNDPFLRNLNHRTKSRVDECFRKWCQIYGLIREGRYLPVEEASPYEPAVSREILTRAELAHSFGGHTSVTMVA